MNPQKPDDNHLPQSKESSTSATGNEAVNDISISDAQTRPGTVVTGGSAQKPDAGNNPVPPTSSGGLPGFGSTPDASVLPASSVPASPPPPGKKKKKLAIAALIVGVAVLLLGAGAAAYFAYYLPKKPENVLKTALINTFSQDKVTSVQFEGEVNVTENASSDMFGLDFSGAASQEGPLNLSMAIDALVTTVTVDVRSTDGKTFYAKLGGLDGLPELLGANGQSETLQPWLPLIAQVNDQWYEINESLIQQLTGVSPEGAELSAEDRQKLAQAYEKHRFLSVKETLDDEVIDGTDSYHYKVVIDNAKLKSFVNEVQAADINALTFNQAMLDSFNGFVERTDFSKYPVDVWIAKDTNLFTQFTYSMQEDDATFDMRLTVTDYNQPVNVEAPENAKSILEIFSGLLDASESTLQEAIPANTSEETNGISL